MEFIAREVKRSKKKKRLHAFPPDKPDFNSKGLYILLNFFSYLTSVGYETPSLRARNCGFGVIMVLLKGFIININLFSPLGRKIVKNEEYCCWWWRWFTAQGI